VKITEKEVRYVAGLARLELSPDEVARFTSQLNGILEYMEQLGGLDTEGVEPTAHVLPLTNVLRDDEPAPSLGREDTLSNAPEAGRGHFVVPRIIE
jgi:aspartyl-tRNA(Asn)/glutamyl-tRNA(Gln) amidotransferase subunit C